MSYKVIDPRIRYPDLSMSGDVVKVSLKSFPQLFPQQE